jgi:hypothetical protein
MMHAGVGPETVISVQLILLCLTWINISCAEVLTNVPRSNPLNIDWYPAPPPADGPPLSAGASRNPALLPFEISGIIGAYLLSLFFVAVGIFFARRKLRRRIAPAYKSRDIEMLDTNLAHSHKIFDTGSPQSKLQDPSPVSPIRVYTNFSWPAQEKSPEENVGPHPYVYPPVSPHSAASPYSTTQPSLGDPNVDARIVERDQHHMERDLEDIYAHVMEQDEARAAGISVAELPPPPQLRPGGPTPVPAPARLGSPSKKIEKPRPSNIVLSDENKPSRTSRASSIISSIISPRKSAFKKELHISSPIQSPKDASYNREGTAEEREPLTPRFYAPLPPPPVPTDQVPFQSPRQNSQSSVESYSRTIAQQLEPNGPSAPSAFPKTTSPVSFSSQMTGATLPSSPKPQQSHFPLSIHTPSPSSAASSTRQLPFRQFQPALTSPSFSSFQQSTKTTVFERTAPDRSRGPATGGLRSGTPWSPGAVPYSPYQPFSPVIPVTPRLVTKDDRKMMKKQEKKLGIVPRPELVDDDLWDSAY